MRWVKEVWLSSTASRGLPGAHRALAPSALSDAWHAARPADCSSWRRVRGPLAALGMSARRLGWTLDSLTRWRTGRFPDATELRRVATPLELDVTLKRAS